MLTLEHNQLVVRFPEIHPDAVCTISFQRTLRIPDDNRVHNLPPSLGNFPLAHVDDHAAKLPAAWQKRGGIFLPMHETEAMWVRFHSKYPFAVKIAAGKINAVTGKPWTAELSGPRTVGPAFAQGQVCAGRVCSDYNSQVFGSGIQDPYLSDTLARYGRTNEEQDYLSVPKQPWLDGFCVGKGKVRQFVAMPLGEGYTAEEQITGEALHGGLQIIVYPIRPEFYRPPKPPRFHASGAMANGGGVLRSMSMNATFSGATAKSASADMGMAPGGLMEQTIHQDQNDVSQYDQSRSAKCFVHLLNSAQYQMVTGRVPPHAAPTAADYTRAGLPWFKEWNVGANALDGGKPLKGLDSVANLGNKKGETPLPENAPLPPNAKLPFIVKNPNEVVNGDW